MIRDVLEEELTPVESVSGGPAGCANCAGRVSWIWSCPKPAGRDDSEVASSKSVRAELAGHAICEALTSWIRS